MTDSEDEEEDEDEHIDGNENDVQHKEMEASEMINTAKQDPIEDEGEDDEE